MKQKQSRLLPIYVAIAVVVGVLIGNFYGSNFSEHKVGLINTSSNKLSDLLHIIDEQYVDSVSIHDLVEKSLPAILRELDPHSTYVTAEDAEASMQDLKGSFSGIGIQFTIYEDTIRVIKVIPGGPSETAGLHPGDRIVNIDDSVYVGKDIKNETAMKKLKGPESSKVKLGILRAGSPKMLTFNITRGSVPVKSIDCNYMLDKTTGYIRITSWGDTTYSEFVLAMNELKEQGMSNVVIDLRGNLGGYLTAATEVANEFLPQGRLIVYTEGRRYPHEEFNSDGTGSFQDMPLVVLVDEQSASASEIFSGAMQDNDRATIIGRRTFGKGLVQIPLNFRDGSYIRLTRARYYTPSGRCVQKPYTPGDEEEYESEVFTRAEEYFNPDSIKTTGEKFSTRLGRTVYGGGGIIPDHFIPRDTLGITQYFRDLFVSSAMPNFAYHFVDSNRAQISECTDYKAVVEFVKKHNIVEELANFAATRGVARNNQHIATSRSLMNRFITSFIIGDVLETAEQVKFNNESDPYITKALEIISKGETFPKNDKAADKKNDKKGKKTAHAGRHHSSECLVCTAGRRHLHYLRA